jgi:subtilisin family serine protease
MNPGLGIRVLHDQGLTGEGVAVAIIDQPLYQDHPEFAGKIRMYRDFCCESDTSMHGPAVTSLLVGENCGTAPGASVYYAAAPSWLADATYYADALDWLVSVIKELPEGQKIRVVSVSAILSGEGSEFANGDAWDEAVTNAEKEGILVLDGTRDSVHGIVAPCYYDPADPENVKKCTPGYPNTGTKYVGNGYVCAPCSPRTTAEEYVKGDYSYQYNGAGGLSWSIPYTAGVLALGWQIDPTLTPDEAVELLFESAYKPDENANIIDPAAFVAAVRDRSVVLP